MLLTCWAVVDLPPPQPLRSPSLDMYNPLAFFLSLEISEGPEHMVVRPRGTSRGTPSGGREEVGFSSPLFLVSPLVWTARPLMARQQAVFEEDDEEAV